MPFGTYIRFIDESGTPPKPTSQNPRPYFVIAGVIIHEDQWHEISRELRQLHARANFRVFGQIKWRYFGGQNDDPDNKLAHPSQEDRDKFRKLCFEILTRRKSVKIAACVTDARRAYKLKCVKNQDDIYFYTYKPVVERFLYYLQDITKEIGSCQLGSSHIPRR
jgi:hypothetical protein